MILPPSITFSGDRNACAKWLGQAKYEFTILESTLAAGVQQASRTIRPQPGVKIVCRKELGRQFIEICVPPAGGVGTLQEKEETEFNIIAKTSTNENVDLIPANYKTHIFSMIEREKPCQHEYKRVPVLFIPEPFVSNFNQVRYVNNDLSLKISLLHYEVTRHLVGETEVTTIMRVHNHYGGADLRFTQGWGGSFSPVLLGALSEDLQTLYVVQGMIFTLPGTPSIDQSLSYSVYELQDVDNVLEWVLTDSGSTPAGVYSMSGIGLDRNGYIYGWSAGYSAQVYDGVNTCDRDDFKCTPPGVGWDQQLAIQRYRGGYVSSAIAFKFSILSGAFSSAVPSMGNTVSHELLDYAVIKNTDAKAHVSWTDYVGLKYFHECCYIDWVFTWGTETDGESRNGVNGTWEIVTHTGGSQGSFLIFDGAKEHEVGSIYSEGNQACIDNAGGYEYEHKSYGEDGSESISKSNRVTIASHFSGTYRRTLTSTTTTFTPPVGRYAFVVNCTIGNWGPPGAEDTGNVPDAWTDLHWPFSVGRVTSTGNGFISSDQETGMSFFGLEIDDSWRVFCIPEPGGSPVEITEEVLAGTEDIFELIAFPGNITYTKTIPAQ